MADLGLQTLPQLKDSLSHIYIEHAILEREEGSLLVLQETGKTLLPIAAFSVMLLGPGTSITHAAIKLAAECGCSIVWVGQDGEHFYAQGLGETRRAYHLIQQAKLVSDIKTRMQVVLKMYSMRFGKALNPQWTLEQVRGYEGSRVRDAYAAASREFHVQWAGRNYDRHVWDHADPINRALSAANALINGLCHAAIVSGGYSPALGFIHTGRQLSFVYDIADLYKTEFSIPSAFKITAENEYNVEKRVREELRYKFQETKFLSRILEDIDRLLQINTVILSNEDENEPTLWWGEQAERIVIGDYLQGDA